MPLEVVTTPLKTFGHLVRLVGSLDTNTFPLLETEIQRLVADGTPLIALDLSTLDYISSAGIRIVQKGIRAMEKNGGQLKLVNPQAQVARVFEFIKVTPINQMFGTMEEFDAFLATMQRKPGANSGGNPS